jgi:HTH-type transcriptional regulator / antitoxin HipB
MNNDKIATMLKFHRKKAGLSRNALAELAGVGKTAVFDLENGKTTVQMATLQKVLNVLNIKCHFESPFMNEFNQQF